MAPAVWQRITSGLILPLTVSQYREDDESGYPSNIMFDKRVVRGNTYAARILPADATTSTLNGDTKKTMR